MLRSLIRAGTVIINADFEDRDSMFRWIAEDAQTRKLVSSAAEFYDCLVKREEQISTEVAKGIAMPHTRTDTVKQMFLYVVLSQRGIKYSGLGSRVRIVFLVGATKDTAHYLDAMAMIARLLSKEKMRSALTEARTPGDVVALIEESCRTDKATQSGTEHLHGLLLVLNDCPAMETAMELAIELGVKGCQVFDSTNVASKVAFQFPFLSLFSARNDHLAARTLFGVVEHESIAGRLFAHLKKEGIDIGAPGAGVLFTFPLGAVYGGIDEELI